MINIIGTATYLPEKVLTNDDLQKMVQTSDEWIVERTGIRERRIASQDVYASDLGAEAAKRALKDAGVEASRIDLLIVATMSPDMLCPSTACVIQQKIEAWNAAAFDLSAACSGFLYALDVAKKFLESGEYKTALVIGTEKLSSLVNWKDRTTCILFGDGAGAAVLKKGEKGHSILGIWLGADGRGTDLLKIPAGGSMLPASRETVDKDQHCIQMDGREVYKRAIDVMCRISQESLQKSGLKKEDIQLFVPHQANKRIIDSVAKRLSFPEEKVFLNVDRYGNTSAASIILALDDAKREGRLHKGDHVLIAVFGAGFTWGGAVLKW
ncbi:MAG: ketoacyl-ACP synthase III [Chlamydiae bacterium]|nr:ketoacyl-ACP synthase III [Chlamydiota bacterium]MBI3266741.1 ketoacyl-ACP synthase III [Chlamydiota bacterium]